jgi:hypothetical protein
LISFITLMQVVYLALHGCVLFKLEMWLKRMELPRCEVTGNFINDVGNPAWYTGCLVFISVGVALWTFLNKPGRLERILCPEFSAYGSVCKQREYINHSILMAFSNLHILYSAFLSRKTSSCREENFFYTHCTHNLFQMPVFLVLCYLHISRHLEFNQFETLVVLHLNLSFPTL